jgi:hypothetical protein
MAGLVPAIHALPKLPSCKDVDARHIDVGFTRHRQFGMLKSAKADLSAGHDEIWGGGSEAREEKFFPLPLWERVASNERSELIAG